MGLMSIAQVAAISVAVALPPLHNPVPATAPAWARVLRPGQTFVVPRTVCPYGLSDLHAYNRQGRGYVQKRDEYGLYWARRTGRPVVGWFPADRAFVSTTARMVVIAVWCT